jgi:hypothetical protein
VFFVQCSTFLVSRVSAEIICVNLRYLREIKLADGKELHWNLAIKPLRSMRFIYTNVCETNRNLLTTAVNLKMISLFLEKRIRPLTLTIDNILLIGSLLLFISILAGKASSRLGVPVLVLFIIVGMIAGSEDLGGISFKNPGVTQFIGIIALCFILLNVFLCFSPFRMKNRVRWFISSETCNPCQFNAVGTC